MRRLVLLLVAGLLVAACSSGSPTNAPAPSASPIPSAPASGAELVGPVILDPQTTSATVTVGRMVVFKVDNPETWAISADPAGVVKVQKGANDGSATFNPGAQAVAPGKATVTLANPAGDKLVFTITVK